MSWPKPPPFFTLPAAAGVPDWTALPQPVRDQWNSWAKANRIGGPDYAVEIRPGVDAFTFLTQADSAANGGSTSLYLPPAAQLANPRQLNRTIVAASVADIIAFQSSLSATGASDVLVFATAPAATVNALDLTGNELVGTFPIATTTQPGEWLTDIGAAYVGIFGSLAGLLGQFIQFWAFNVINGQMIYAGSWVSAITNVAPAGTAYFWPLNEIAGLRRSITQPADLTPQGVTASGAGAGDIVMFTENIPFAFVESLGLAPMAAAPGDLTINLWMTAAGASLHVDNAWFWDSPTKNHPDLFVEVPIPGTGFKWWYWDGATTQPLSDAAAGALVIGQWYMTTFKWEQVPGRMTVYRDGVNVASTSPVMPVWSYLGTLELGCVGAASSGTFLGTGQVGLWNRALSDAEVATLFNGGSFLPYPFA